MNINLQSQTATMIPYNSTQKHMNQIDIGGVYPLAVHREMGIREREKEREREREKERERERERERKRERERCRNE